jgi:Fe-S cluster assembly protein SufD
MMNPTNTDKNISNDFLIALEAQVNTYPVLKKIRQEAFTTLQQVGLPGIKHEEYRYAPLTKAIEKIDAPAEASSQDLGNSLENITIPNTDTYTIVFVNGVFKPEHSSALTIEGVTIQLMPDIVEKSPEKITDYLSSFSEAMNDPFTAWNIAGWNSGLFISVEKNKQIKKPIAIYNIIDARNSQVVNIVRNLVVVGKSAEVTIIQKANSIGKQAHFLNTVTEAIVQENAGLTLYNIQHDSGEHYQFNRTHVLQHNASRANTYTISMVGKIIRNNLQLTLDGEGCESHLYGIYLLKGDTLVDNHTVADHRKPNSFSNELYKGMMDDRSRGVFNGKIYVRPNAQKTNAFQSNRNILLSDSAKVNTKPQLEIWADDVKCSHGCTSGQLDEEALFYLQSRGIDKDSAQAMLLYAFAGEVLDAVTMPGVKDYLEKVISLRLHQNN